jgi:hypothetical protein
VYNEEKSIEDMFEKVVKWKLKPECWVWINDGSTDYSGYKIESMMKKYKSELNVECVHMPRKEKGNLATLGCVYNYVFKTLDLKSRDFDFMTTLDVDTDVSKSFYYNINELFRLYKDLGAVSGWSPGGVSVEESLIGTSLSVRWSIVKKIEKFWDVALDSFLIIKSEKYGYKNKRTSSEWGKVKSPLASGHVSVKGAIWNGCAWAYVGASWWSIFKNFLFRLVNRWNAFNFLKGYIWNRDWRCDDQDVLDFYNRPFNIFSINKKLFQKLFRKRTKRK